MTCTINIYLNTSINGNNPKEQVRCLLHISMKNIHSFFFVHNFVIPGTGKRNLYKFVKKCHEYIQLHYKILIQSNL